MDSILNWKKKRAAVYTRVSTMEQVEKGTGLDVQLDVCRKMCSIKNYELVKEYSDGGVSGTVPATKRKAFGQFFEDAKTEKYDVLVFYCFDRLAREIRVFLNIVDELRRLGIKIVTCKENIDTTTDNGDFMMNIYASVSNLELRTIRTRLMSGKLQKIMITGYAGGRIAYGYRAVNKVVERDPETCHIVKKIFTLHKQKVSLNRIAQMLNEGEVPPPRKGGKWYAKTVSIIIKNRDKYEGGLMNNNQNDIKWPKLI